VVQDPSDAAYPSMLRSALEHVPIDHCLPLSQLPELLIRLAAVPAEVRLDRVHPAATAQGKEMTAEYKLDQPVAVTCPDCGGALRQTELGTLSQFRCHIGHVYTAEVMVAAQFAALEGSFEAAMRSLSERRELCRQMRETSRTAKNPMAEAQWEAARREAEERTAVLRQLLEKEWTHPDGTDLLRP
jgi:two-component system chemotaxis response regulator CheB